LINIDRYDEEVTFKKTLYQPYEVTQEKTYGIFTSVDKLVCTATFRLPSEELPDNLLVRFYYYINGKKEKYLKSMDVNRYIKINLKGKNSKVIAAGQGCNKEGDIVSCRYSPRSFFNPKEGDTAECSAKIILDKKEIRHESSNLMTQAHYVFYFFPINTNYGNIEEQYKFFTELSEINKHRGDGSSNSPNTITKKILLNRKNLDYSAQEVVCCNLKLRVDGVWNHYPRWIAKELVKTKCQPITSGWIKEVVPDSKCSGRDKSLDIIELYVKAESRNILNQNLFQKNIKKQTKKSFVTLILSEKDIYGVCSSNACSQLPFSSINMPLTYTSAEGALSSLGHEFPHRISFACDEYSYKKWIDSHEQLISSNEYDSSVPAGCPNPEREDQTIGFPECCLKPPSANSICGNKKKCVGMAYKDSEGNIPDKNPHQVTYNSIMGKDGNPGAIYPKRLGCPFRDC
jgi:hypothetical protein